MGYNSNCVFTNESEFHINLKRTMTWSKKGTHAEIVQSLIRIKTTIILHAISPYGVVNAKIKVPFAEASKKRKVTGGSKAHKTTRTVNGYYMNFISSTLNVMDCHEQFKGHCLVMNNTPMHTSDRIRRFIERSRYGCVYLPPYSLSSIQLNISGQLQGANQNEKSSCRQRPLMLGSLKYVKAFPSTNLKDSIAIQLQNLKPVSITCAESKKKKKWVAFSKNSIHLIY